MYIFFKKCRFLSIEFIYFRVDSTTASDDLNDTDDDAGCWLFGGATFLLALDGRECSETAVAGEPVFPDSRPAVHFGSGGLIMKHIFFFKKGRGLNLSVVKECIRAIHASSRHNESENIKSVGII